METLTKYYGSHNPRVKSKTGKKIIKYISGSILALFTFIMVAHAFLPQDIIQSKIDANSEQWNLLEQQRIEEQTKYDDLQESLRRQEIIVLGIKGQQNNLEGMNKAYRETLGL